MQKQVSLLLEPFGKLQGENETGAGAGVVDYGGLWARR